MFQISNDNFSVLSATEDIQLQFVKFNESVHCIVSLLSSTSKEVQNAMINLLLMLSAFSDDIRKVSSTTTFFQKVYTLSNHDVNHHSPLSRKMLYNVYLDSLMNLITQTWRLWKTLSKSTVTLGKKVCSYIHGSNCLRSSNTASSQSQPLNR